MTILFISYYYDPYPGVGAKRITYWAENIHQYGFHSTVLTATEQNSKKDNIIYIAPENKKQLLSHFIKDAGVQWLPALKKYFLKNKTSFNYDYVLISGGPFMHFGIGKFLKQHFNTKVILDFRDPFANNPRFNDGVFKKTIKTFFEKKFYSNSDIIIAVNDVCKNLFKKTEKTTVINNGYDESGIQFVINQSTNYKKGLIINGGKLYDDCDVNHLISVIANNKGLFFKQIGQKKEFSIKNERIKSIDFLPYTNLLEEIAKAEITTVLTSGKPFETPTKIYDYIALNKKILIITEGGLKRGEIDNILKDYPNVVWTKNNQTDIKNAIIQLQKMELKPFDSSKYSRAYGLKKLVKILENIK